MEKLYESWNCSLPGSWQITFNLLVQQEADIFALVSTGRERVCAADLKIHTQFTFLRMFYRCWTNQYSLCRSISVYQNVLKFAHLKFHTKYDKLSWSDSNLFWCPLAVQLTAATGSSISTNRPERACLISLSRSFSSRKYWPNSCRNWIHAWNSSIGCICQHNTSIHPATDRSSNQLKRKFIKHPLNTVVRDACYE